MKDSIEIIFTSDDAGRVTYNRNGFIPITFTNCFEVSLPEKYKCENKVSVNPDLKKHIFAV